MIGRPPYETSETKTTYRKILRNNYSFPSNVSISEDAKDLIKKILVLDPIQRPTLDEILQHPFVKNHANKSISTQSQTLKKHMTLLSAQSTMHAPLDQACIYFYKYINQTICSSSAHYVPRKY